MSEDGRYTCYILLVSTYSRTVVMVKTTFLTPSIAALRLVNLSQSFGSQNARRMWAVKRDKMQPKPSFHMRDVNPAPIPAFYQYNVTIISTLICVHGNTSRE